MSEIHVMQNRIISLLEPGLSPSHLEVVNESHMHSVPENSETHFKLTVVSKAFDGLRPVQRHQKVYSLLAGPLAEGVHALAMHLYTNDEWQPSLVPESPNCMGGSK